VRNIYQVESSVIDLQKQMRTTRVTWPDTNTASSSW